MAFIRTLAVLAALVLAASALYTKSETFSTSTCTGAPDELSFAVSTPACIGYSCFGAPPLAGGSVTDYASQTCNVSTIAYPAGTPYFVTTRYSGAGCSAGALVSASGTKAGVCSVSGTQSSTFTCNGNVASLVLCLSSTTCSGSSCSTVAYATSCQADGANSLTYACSAASALIAPIASFVLAAVSVLLVVVTAY